MDNQNSSNEQLTWFIHAFFLSWVATTKSQQIVAIDRFSSSANLDVRTLFKLPIVHMIEETLQWLYNRFSHSPKELDLEVLRSEEVVDVVETSGNRNMRKAIIGCPPYGNLCSIAAKKDACVL